MDKYIVFGNSDSKTMYPDNTSYKFRVKLAQRLTFEGLWFVSLLELHFGKIILTNLIEHTVDIMCNLCDTSLVGEGLLPLLRRIDLRDGPNYHFNTLWHIPVVVTDTSFIDIYIKPSANTSLSFLKEDTKVTLLLRRYPFIE